MSSLKWKIAKYLLVFAAVLISLIALFQIVLLEPMYENSKISTVKQASNEIVSSLGKDDLIDTLYRVSAENDLCIRIYSEDNNIVFGSNMGCVLYRMSNVELLEEIATARNNGNTNLSTKDEVYEGPESVKIKDITYTRIVESNAGTHIVMVNASITPVDATVSTLTNQLWMISGIVLLFVILLVFLMHRNIAKPLIALNDSAKQLSRGTYISNDKANAYQEVRELNQTLLQASLEIQKADQAKRDLIANVSHDLRTPLTMISGYGEMMKDLPGEKTDENCQVIIDEARRLTYLVNDLLDLSKLEEKQIQLVKTVFDMSALIHNEMRKYEVYHVQQNFDFELHVEDHLLVYADEKRISQVFNNFMTNAINYSLDQKKVIVRAYRKENVVRIEIQDFGSGIDQKNLANIWDRYYKISAEHVRFSSGSGIGLAIVKEILNLHQVQYGVSSEIGKGSTFYFELECAK